jgi:23S rRNA pseudouridine955/2504/2580 synthase
MEFITLEAQEDDSERRLDRIMRRALPSKPLAKIYECIRKGFIRVNHKRASARTLVVRGDLIECAAFLFETKSALPPASPKIMSAIPVLFQNEFVVVVDKPRGIAVHPNSKIPRRANSNTAFNPEKESLSVSEWLKAAYGGAESLSFVPSPLHRLDKDTTGILVCSKNLLGARWFSLALKNHLIKKTYLALVEGSARGEQTWEDSLCRQNAPPQTALTRVQPLAWGALGAKTVTLLELTLETGRKRQIRKQSALRGFPLLGDTLHGGSILETGGAPRTYFLHAISMRFPPCNPLHLPSVITSALPKDFLRLASLLGWKEDQTISMASP